MIPKEQTVHPDTLTLMRQQGGEWAAYRLSDKNHPYWSHLKYMKIGPDCSYQTPPDIHPEHSFGHVYHFDGMVDLRFGVITPF